MPTDSHKLVLFDFKTQKWTDLVEMSMGYPSWSLDSKFIYFEGYTRAPNEAWCEGIYRVSIRERKVERVVSLEGVRQAIGDWVGLGPDGSPVLARDAGSQDIYALTGKRPEEIDPVVASHISRALRNRSLNEADALTGADPEWQGAMETAIAYNVPGNPHKNKRSF